MNYHLTIRWQGPGGEVGLFSVDDLDSRRSKITFGRGSENSIILDHSKVSRHHGTIYWDGRQLNLQDEDSSNGIYSDGQRIQNIPLKANDQFKIGPFQISIVLQPSDGRPADEDSGTVLVRDSSTNLFRQISGSGLTKDIPAFLKSSVVDENQIYDSGIPTQETTYLAVGGGIGSFVWVDHLRIYGVPVSKIQVLALEDVPHHKYRRLCEASQIPLHERLRSNSESCPDNIWGYPGYAMREAAAEFKRGAIHKSIRRAWQVFGEPAFAESFTPRADHVFHSIDREAERIRWRRMLVKGRGLIIRKTNRDRYVVVFAPQHAPGEIKLIFCDYLHLCVGYPGTRLLKDLQDYRINTNDHEKVVNAYEDHDEIYDKLRRHGGTVIVRGRGIVASRILQRVKETRDASNRKGDIQLIHLLRSRTTKGNRYRMAKRRVVSNWEFQPFNWPKSCWGGELRKKLERAGDKEKSRLYNAWGGTTTADRGDWLRIIKKGQKQGWYTLHYGEVADVYQGKRGKVITNIKGKEGNSRNYDIEADYIIDCVGLIADITNDPFLKDLIDQYELPRNIEHTKSGRTSPKGLKVNRHFEIEKMKNGKGRFFSAGVVTSFGPLAAVDSFLGLQYSAIHSIEQLRRLRAPGIQKMTAMRSFNQWIRWCRRKEP